MATLQLLGGDITVNAYKWFKPSQITYPGGNLTKQIYDPLMRLTDITVTNPFEAMEIYLI
ncbi:MAG: hypothetical protein HY080_01190 [Gammaproteobacteria bacterium]|nr:hypothetical protein [Gammaproteobacteria bacterium]